jgi:hypothetical protein
LELSDHEAYQAMILFLQEYARQVSSPEPLMLLIHDLEVAGDNVPNDPASWSDWQDAIAKVKREGLPHDPQALESWMRREREARRQRGPL